MLPASGRQGNSVGGENQVADLFGIVDRNAQLFPAGSRHIEAFPVPLFAGGGPEHLPAPLAFPREIASEPQRERAFFKREDVFCRIDQLRVPLQPHRFAEFAVDVLQFFRMFGGNRGGRRL